MATMTSLTLFLLLSFMEGLSGFVAERVSFRDVHSGSALHAVVTYNQIRRIGYTVEVTKPLGIIFGENDAPFNGLVVLEANEDGNGALAGIEVGQQLLSVNGKSVVGDDFDTAMDLLRQAGDPMDIQMYAGTVRQLYTILKNVEDDDEEEEQEEVEEIIMDENYVSPVVVEEEEREPISVGDVFNLLKDAGSKILEKSPEEPKEKKDSKGLFGMFQQESIQLDGEDASSIN